MPSQLDKYRQKRDFTVTSEPRGRASRKHAAGLSFVIQKHAARRLHYDLRLELDGTLKSWAVPKGPSLDPADKRMAVQVEDHPLDYGSFEGVIAPGQYGAGTVIVWDRGTWEPVGDPLAGYRDGKLKFALQGEKLHGHWTLVRMHGRDQDTARPAWLLIKERDEEARAASAFDVVAAMPDSVLSGKKAAAKPAARAAAKGTRKTAQAPAADDMPAGAKAAGLPLMLAPQLASLVEQAPPAHQDWLYEVKFDGYRLLARVDGKDVRLFTRNGNDWTSRLRSLARAVAALGLHSGWLDGEIVIADKQGRTDFQALQNAFESAQVEDVQYYVFDLPYCNGFDLRKVPLAARRDMLRHALAAGTSSRLRFSESFDAGPAELLRAVCKLRFEGVIGKRADAPYVSARSPTWIKLKCTRRQEFVVVGYTDPAGSRQGIGALLLGVHDERGRLRYAGKVGTGFDTQTLASLQRKLEPLRQDASPMDSMQDTPPGRMQAHWVKPRLVAEIAFGNWTREGRVRHAVFHGLRSDKPASAISVERATDTREDHAMAATPARKPGTTRSSKDAGKARNMEMETDSKTDSETDSETHAGRTPKKSATKAAARTASAATAGAGAGVRVSHADRVIDPATGLTKGHLVAYYEAIAPLLLPHLRGRPVALVRGPAGIGGELFFQKHGDSLRMPGINTLDPALWPTHPPLLEIASEAGIVAAAQFNVIELHTWNANKRAIGKPDRVIFDLDPGEGVPFGHVREGAAMMKAVLDELGLSAFLKTSGGKGLHVVLPIAARLDWETVKDFSHQLVLHMTATVPQRFVARSGPRNRVGKIFIDYLRNGFGATTVAAYSARARPGLGVSVPLAWDELDEITSGAQWNIASLHERIGAQRADPWAAYARSRQTLTRAIRLLAA
ncbi:DNA ligase D [Cupriavidus sp. 2TAF22]|uniref:DNA ligase D n=1 Tax=unclassified Cupriavidus TaxID=2640874 RepID=UPI003F8F0E8D